MFANTNAAFRKGLQKVQLSKCVSTWERAQIKPLHQFKTSVSFGQKTDSDFAANTSFAKRDWLQRGGQRDSSDTSTSSSLHVEQGIAASIWACPAVMSGILLVSETDIQEEDKK